MLVIFAQASVPIPPAKGSRDDPPLFQRNNPFRLLRTQHCPDNLAQAIHHPHHKRHPVLATIRPNRIQSRDLLAYLMNFGEDTLAAFSFWHIDSCHHDS